jgi:micrococcal nuclease
MKCGVMKIPFPRKGQFVFLLLTAILAVFLAADISFARKNSPIRTVIGKVTKVSDGDTIHVTTPEQTNLTVRLYGIDAPETPKIHQHTGRVNKPGQPMGEAAWGALRAKIIGQTVRLDIMDIDRYKRMVGIIWTDNRNINLEMVKEGFAEAYIEYLRGEPYRQQFIRAQDEAQTSKRGIWALSPYERPKDFRRRTKTR